MKQQRSPNKIRFRISTVFLLLSLFCLALDQFFPFFPDVAQTAMQRAGQIPLAAVVFGDLGPIWAAIGALFAIAGALANLRKLWVVLQMICETILCVAAFIFFPAY